MTIADGNVVSGTPPAEGLFCQCFKAIARFDGRVAWWFTRDPRCPRCHEDPPSLERHHVTAGEEVAQTDGIPACSGGLPFTHTDDPDEAQAAFERGAEYVLTGVME